MTTSPLGIGLIKDAEGYSATLYLDEGHPAIGYGCDLTADEAAAYANREITEDEADALLRTRLPRIEGAITSAVKVTLTQGQFDALVDFCYNLGVAAFQSSTLLRKLNAGATQSAADEFLRWDHVGVLENAGLKARRERERDMFLGTENE